jgi:hypothetical protein
MRRLGVMCAVVVVAMVAASARPANGSRYMRVGIYDDAQTLFGPIDQSMVMLKQLHVQELRVTLFWGGTFGVAKTRPANATSPTDPAYNWTLYDRLVRYANQYGMHVLFSVYGTPSWANGGRPLNYAPTRGIDLRNFVLAAAKRYGGEFPDGQGGKLPPVKEWLAWNEPNNPNFLKPQFTRTAKGWTVQSALDYVRICNAVYTGVHATLIRNERVACGVTGPRGNNQPTSDRPSVSPLAFLRAVKKDGLKNFDAWAHHPYYAGASDQPTTKPVGARGNPATAVTLGNFSDLTSLLTKLYGNKRIWITEYGYQTNPPDKLFGVSYAKQATYLKQAFAIARKNARVDMMIWFLLRDEPRVAGWQSGLLTATGKRKPSFNAFMQMALASPPA